MPLKKQDNTLTNVRYLLTMAMKSMTNALPIFGYRERMKIERGLFLLLKYVCKKELDYNVRGFNHVNKEEIMHNLRRRKSKSLFKQTIEQIFQLKIFIVALSSDNAYVRGDALSRVGVTKRKTYSFVEKQIKSIFCKISQLK